MKNRQKIIALLLGAAVSLTALGGCGQKAQEEETAEDIAIVEAAVPTVGDLTLRGEFIATMNPDDSVYVIPKTTAEVLQVKVSAGDVVAQGDVLAVLDDTIAQINMENAQIAAKNAQITLDNAQHSYNLSFGDGATTINDMQSDSTLSQAEDGVTQLQESLVDAMDEQAKYKDKLADAEAELAAVKEDYDYREDVDEIKDYAESLKNDGNMAGYAAAMERYQAAAAQDAKWQQTIDGYKSALDQLDESIEKLQDNIDTTYESYSQAVTSTNIKNGEMQEEQKKVSQNSISQAQLSMENSKLTVEQAQENLDMYTLKATISGVVETVNIKEHDFATSSNPAFVISNKDTMTATYYVSEDVRNTFSIGQPITIEKDGKVYDGEVLEIGSAIDAATGLFKVKASVKGDTSQFLSGTKAKVTTNTYFTKNALIIPYDAVYYDGTQAYVYTVEDGVAKKTNVTTGLFDVDNIVITEGITKEDMVITTWSAQLREGVAVSVQAPQE